MGLSATGKGRHHAPMRWLARTVAYAGAVSTATVLGCLASSYFVLLGLTELGVAIPWADRLAVYGRDVLGMGPLLAVVVGVALLVALPLGALGIRLLPGFPWHRACGYGLACGLAVPAALLAMQAALGAMPVAGARSWPGLLAQAFAGVAAGAVFAALRRGYAAGPSASAPAAASGDGSAASGSPASSSSTTS